MLNYSLSFHSYFKQQHLTSTKKKILWQTKQCLRYISRDMIYHYFIVYFGCAQPVFIIIHIYAHWKMYEIYNRCNKGIRVSFYANSALDLLTFLFFKVHFFNNRNHISYWFHFNDGRVIRVMMRRAIDSVVVRWLIYLSRSLKDKFMTLITHHLIIKFHS